MDKAGQIANVGREPGPLADFDARYCHVAGASLDERPAQILYVALRRALNAIRTTNAVANRGVPGLSAANCCWLTAILCHRLNDAQRYLSDKERSTREILGAAGFHSNPVQTTSMMGVSYTELAMNIVELWIARLKAAIQPQTMLTAEAIDGVHDLAAVVGQIRRADDYEEIACGLDHEWQSAAAKWATEKGKRSDSEIPPPQQQQNESALGPLERALSLLATHPEWTNKAIAEAAGVSRTTLYKPNFIRFQQARKAINSGRSERDRGHVDNDGNLEAYDE